MIPKNTINQLILTCETVLFYDSIIKNTIVNKLKDDEFDSFINNKLKKALSELEETTEKLRTELEEMSSYQE